jgi:hypothetical protein
MELIFAFVAGAAALAAYQTYRDMKAGATMPEALRSVILGPGPYRPPK